MPVLFVSHSSRDDAAADALEIWLRGNGIDDLFVDHHGIAGGERWPEALRASAGTCRVVVCLVSEHWLASDECFAEFRAAWYMGKRIIPLFLLPSRATLDGAPKERLAKITAENQGLDLGACVSPNGRLEIDADNKVARLLMTGLRAAGAISRVGLDPEAFTVNPTLRPTPFPGLESFGDDDADAALFYGRSGEIAEALDELRQMRAARDPRAFVILGASGAGKSSLLKAGVVPRLRRETPAWLPLRTFRPGADPLLNFAEALARTLVDFGKLEAQGVIRDRLFAAWSHAGREGKELTESGLAELESALEAEGQELRKGAGYATATILISVDQAEELARSEGDSGEALADYLRAALAAATGSWQLAFTIRSDSFPELQGHRRFRALKARPYDLRAIPNFRFDTLVEEPAKRYHVDVKTALVDALMADAPKEDALPLLAFALQRLWHQYSAAKVLTKDNYERVGGLKGLIEDAAERALRGLGPDEPLPSAPPVKRLVDLGASTFVPTLAQVNDQGATIRHIATWSDFDEEQQDLLKRFEGWRLLIRKGEHDGSTVEVAHEALFREWTRLKAWLEPERARLDALRALQIDALTWDRNGRDSAFLAHRGRRLPEAVELTEREGYRKRLGQTELDYLKACDAAEQSARQRIRHMRSALGALALVLALGLVGWLNEAPLREAVRWYRVERPYMMAEFRPHLLPAEVELVLKAGDPFLECAKDCPEMVVVPAGSFTMGSPEDEEGHEPSEEPQHEVTFAKPFAVSRFEITFDEWDACAHYGDCDTHISDTGFGRGRQPVINVTWADAQRYAAWLSKMTGKKYRLLSEAEYEYAARAGTSTAYPWGAQIGHGNANCKDCGSSWDNRQPAPVNSFPANAFGLHDMNGNIYQWVEDCYHINYDGAPTDGSAWTGDDCFRVARGGSWGSSSKFLRSAKRTRNAPDLRIDVLGFRVATTLTP
jgi:formylglycine-generating enzyme required for sulfatase activity